MTTVTVSTCPAPSLRADAIVIGVVEGPQGPLLAPGTKAVAEAFDGALIEILAKLGVTGAQGEAVKLPSPNGVEPGSAVRTLVRLAEDAVSWPTGERE
ncbi:hypothetical protein JOF56_006129 [Kibdelosporangium banguiense]|uniref:Leucyl aminopeptidase n=1 Tax=Kibdelosporangium banguiense TaxID=1365924 RepID=A0ABS4TMW4_9PSEU|nr:M17 family peptidase N-terminal domain-containing protein [Kibdelosporangium banguiense]MBP2325744.1 hypothetical protein [Kibdelosporangium banguiense]